MFGPKVLRPQKVMPLSPSKLLIHLLKIPLSNTSLVIDTIHVIGYYAVINILTMIMVISILPNSKFQEYLQQVSLQPSFH